MRASRRNLSSLAFTLLVFALLPLKTDGVDTACCTVSTSTMSSIAEPVSGDEDFFALPTGPSAVMFLLDNSGSMTDFPQCDNGGWGSAPCSYPTLTAAANPTTPAAAPTATITGSCVFASSNALGWMSAITPAALGSYADPGFSGGTGGVNDSPPWSPASCASNNNCLFDTGAYYHYASWNETSATQLAAATRTSPCAALDNSGNVIQDFYHQDVKDYSTACQTCMDEHGFYFFKLRYISNVTTSTSKGVTTTTVTYSDWPSTSGNPELRFRGTFLNANPPKYVSARRAVKQLLKIDDTANLQPRDFIRYGLATFWNTTASGTDLNNGNGGNSAGPLTGDGAKLVVPLGPNCDDADPSLSPPHVSAIVASRNAIINAVNATGSQKIRFNNYTPLAEALFNIGQYFSDTGASGAYQSRFGATWIKKGCPSYSSAGVCAYTDIAAPTTTTSAGSHYDASQDFRESSAGLVGASWAAPGQDQHSVCFACQQSAIIVVTDGMPNNENGLPSSTVTTTHTNQGTGLWDFQRWQPTDYRSACGANRSASGDLCGSYLPLVALYLKQQDQRLNDFTSGFQNITTSTISFGVTDATALKVLSATSSLGGGVPSQAGSYSDLLASLQKAISNIVQRATSFSATAANSLQTSQTTSSESFVARFRPTTGRAWEGHLFQAILFDEHAMGCDPTVGPTDQARVTCGNTTVYPNYPANGATTGDVDANGKNICTGVYLVDQDCDEITDDPTGKFVFIKKKTLTNPTPTEANLYWDAGKVLSNPSSAAYRSAAEPPDSCASDPTTCGTGRNIFTFLNGSKVLLKTDATTLTTLTPFLALDDASCRTILTGAGFTPPAAPTALSTTDKTNCAKQVINYVRGWDVLDQNRNLCYGPGSPANASGCSGEQRDWSSTATNPMWKLGDIFHSTPAVVKPPIDEARCDIAYDNQCVSTIHSPAGLPQQTPIATTNGRDAYAQYVLDKRTRKRVVLVGANDGMLHAFDAGDANVGGGADIFGAYPYTPGSGAELWAFVPPDLLPKLKFLLLNGSDAHFGHQYMVDGSTMVRDIWVDQNGDGTKQSGEFHTIAIVSERSGGTQFHALDVTEPANPAHLWSFPPPCSDDAKYMGESWSEFAPRPPPIGPVKIASNSDPRGFEERWIAMLNGGYDPALVKGRAVFMVDAWTGAKIWRFTDDDFKDATLYGHGNSTSLWPVTAAIGLVDVGDIANQPRYDSDGFFDTATFGDLGGNLWVARFQEPGTLSGGVVTNWYVGRAFEQQRRGADDAQYLTSAGGAVTAPTEVRSQLYFMTANAYDAGTRTLRTFVGGGNREIMLRDVSCGPDNVMGCCQAGCTYADTQTVDDFGGLTETQHFRCEGGLLTRTPTVTSGTTPIACGSAPRNQLTSTTTFTASCGGTTTTFTSQALCDANGVCSTFTPMLAAFSPLPSSAPISDARLTNPQTHNRFYGLTAYGGARTFATLAQAKTFDSNRLSDVAVGAASDGTPNTCGGGGCTLVNVTQAQATYDTATPSIVTTTCADGSTTCRAATASDPGWFYEYGRACPTGTCSPAPPWTDEKTSAAGTIVFGCANWSGFRPIGVRPGGACDNTLGSPTIYGYSVNAISGVPTRSCSFDDLNGTIYRAVQRQTWTPPSAPTVRVTVNSLGQITYSTLQIDPGAPPQSKQMGQRSSVSDAVYWLEVPRSLHQCRHVDPNTCE